MFDSWYVRFLTWLIQVIFIESICNDQELIRQNIVAVRESSPEYQNLSNEESELHFRARIDSYSKIYQVGITPPYSYETLVGGRCNGS